MGHSRARRLVALGVSLGVHLSLFLGLKPEPARERPPIVPIEQPRLVWIDAPPVERLPEPPAIPAKRKARAAAAEVSAPARDPVDAPLAIDVTQLPEQRSGVPSGADGAPHGRTLHPEDLPTAAEQRAEEQARVSARLGGWLGQDLAAARVRGGLPDPFYGQLGVKLRAATDEVPKLIDTDSPQAVLGAFLESWGAGAERYGKTGAPYAEPEGRLENVEKPSAIAEAAAKGGPDAMATLSFLAAGARLQEFADGRAGLELYALVEIRQQPSGAFISATLVRPSGLRPFDTWVTERAQQVGLTFSSDPGTRTHPLRSLWRFDGIIQYRRKLKFSELNGRAVVGMVTMAALSALSGLGNSTPTGTGGQRQLGSRMPGVSGRFDEMTGAMDMVDLTNPTYDCRVTLIEAD